MKDTRPQGLRAAVLAALGALRHRHLRRRLVERAVRALGCSRRRAAGLARYVP